MLDAILLRLKVLETSARIDLDLLGAVPVDQAGFDAMTLQRQSASRAALKSFEQLEDQVARGFRLIPMLFMADASRWHARDYADFMEKLGVLDDAAKWSGLVRLRNELVHDYPLDVIVRFERLGRAITAMPFIFETIERLRRLADAERGNMI